MKNTMTLPTSTLTKKQTKIFTENYRENGKRYAMTVTVRHDDQCGNGHNSFSITADIRENGREYMGGCCHEEIVKHLPELAPYIKWHLTSTDGPMHYVANTLYHAGDRDHNGLRKGEFKQIRHGGDGPLCWSPKLGTLANPWSNTVHSDTKPADVVISYEPMGHDGVGKERDLAAARSCAVWPDATDEQLTVEPKALESALIARLPALMVEFKAAVESLGFTY